MENTNLLIRWESSCLNFLKLGILNDGTIHPMALK